MDFGTPSRTLPTAGAPVVTRSDVIAPRDSVAVELPPEKTVQSAGAGDAVKVDVRARQRDERARADGEQRKQANQFFTRQAARNYDETVETKILIDSKTRAVIVQKKDLDTGQTISQLPDEALLKLRAYSRELTERAREKEGEPPHQVERSA
ncbi:MAG: hypothetical protein DI527_12340 [Chelatococcus sp.]|nr:MAG: hypothetical protein DI527_12340 [Chelatococcus sp.]